MKSKPLPFTIHAVARRAKEHGIPLTRNGMLKAIQQQKEKRLTKGITHSRFARLKREMMAGFFSPKRQYLSRMIRQLVTKDTFKHDKAKKWQQPVFQKRLEELIQKNVKGLVRRKVAMSAGQARQIMLEDALSVYSKVNGAWQKIGKVPLQARNQPALPNESIALVRMGMASTFSTTVEILEQIIRYLERRK